MRELSAHPDPAALALLQTAMRDQWIKPAGTSDSHLLKVPCFTYTPAKRKQSAWLPSFRRTSCSSMNGKAASSHAKHPIRGRRTRHSAAGQT